MRFGSVCSGIEAASVAWNPIGFDAAWVSEIEPFPCALLAHHYPDVPNYGDMTLLPERILSGEVEAPDLFCGGTPCQAFSVAGNRQSLSDARGNLSLTFCEIADAIDHVRGRNNDKPAIIFWENVPGVLNTDDNAFGCFLGELSGNDGALQPPGGRWTDSGMVSGIKRRIAWRVLDAQYFGLAQRRKRVFVVASAREGFNPAEVLFEFDGEKRDIAPSREARKGIAADVNQSVVGALCARDYKGISADDAGEGKCIVEPICFEPRSPDGHARVIGDISPTTATLTSSQHAGIATQYAVRRLTPTECERLQGFPDGYTNIPYRNKDESPDGARYKALGNSWAVPCVRWIGERIKACTA